MFWIEKHISGYTIGIGFNGKLWVLEENHNNLRESYKGTYMQTDEIEIYSYENQRWNVLTGFTNIGFKRIKNLIKIV